MPALSSHAPKTRRPRRERTTAPAHMAQGSSVTTSVQSSRRQRPRSREALRMARSSACAVESWSRTVRLLARVRTAPSRITTAPTGTSPAAAASAAAASASRIHSCSLNRSGSSYRGFFVRDLGLREGDLAIGTFGRHDVVALVELTTEDRERQRILNQPLNRPLERSCAIRRVVTFRCQRMLRLGRQLERELPLRKELPQPRELQLHDVLELCLAERPEH